MEDGAGSGNRTRIASLEGWCFTTKLYPLGWASLATKRRGASSAVGWWKRCPGIARRKASGADGRSRNAESPTTKTPAQGDRPEPGLLSLMSLESHQRPRLHPRRAQRFGSAKFMQVDNEQRVLDHPAGAAQQLGSGERCAAGGE